MSVHKKSLSFNILLSLEKAVDGFIRIEEFSHHGHLYADERPLRKSDIAQALSRLRERKLVNEERSDNGEIIMKLTDEGRDVLGSDLWNESDWDGKWRIVIWDIPEQKRVIRNLFRRNLKKWGFKHLQKSVWISKMNVYNKMQNYIKDLGIDEWVTIVEANKISGFHN